MLDVAAHRRSWAHTRPRRRDDGPDHTPSRGGAHAGTPAAIPAWCGPLNARTTDAGASAGPTQTNSMHMIRHHFLSHDLPAVLAGDLPQQLVQTAGDAPAQNPRADTSGTTPDATPAQHTPSRGVAEPALWHATNATRRHRQNSPDRAIRLHSIPQPLRQPAPSGLIGGSARRPRDAAMVVSAVTSAAALGALSSPPAAVNRCRRRPLSAVQMGLTLVYWEQMVRYFDRQPDLGDVDACPTNQASLTQFKGRPSPITGYDSCRSCRPSNPSARRSRSRYTTSQSVRAELDAETAGRPGRSRSSTRSASARPPSGWRRSANRCATQEELTHRRCEHANLQTSPSGVTDWRAGTFCPASARNR